MKNVSIVVARPIRVVSNGAVKGDKWGCIVCAKSGVVLHCGQPKYIQRVAAGKYNSLVKV
jgi:hypothetical protein